MLDVVCNIQHAKCLVHYVFTVWGVDRYLFIYLSIYCRKFPQFLAPRCAERASVDLFFLSSPRRPAGRRAAACPTAHCACPRRLPWLLVVGGGEALQEGREDPSGSVGRAVGREREQRVT